MKIVKRTSEPEHITELMNISRTYDEIGYAGCPTLMEMSPMFILNERMIVQSATSIIKVDFTES